MRSFRFVLILAALAFAPLAPALAQQAQQLSGAWKGVYGYDTGADMVPFDVTLRVSRGRISGESVERNTFGAPGAAFLPATIEGAVTGTRVHFAKTYDGAAGQSHTVQYDGELVPNGRRIVGRWSLAGVSGPFELAR